ncbi:MAG: response regulator transcription factor [Chitinophagaceae bacterium]|nr:response regulator transcription factor [Chitinophagaceae bacterium]
MNIQVAILEDDEDIRLSFSTLIDLNEEMTLIGAFRTAEDFMESLSQTTPDVVITDIELPGINGIECVKKVKAAIPSIQFMMCSVFEDDDRVFESLSVGATGYIVKNTTPEKLYMAIREIYEGGSPMSAHIARKVVASFAGKHQIPEKSTLLTARENEVLQHLSAGLRYKEIADLLNISNETVRKHTRNIYEKLQVSSRMEAVNKAFGSRRGIAGLLMTLFA